MSKKKIEVVELNKKEEEIILEEKQSPLIIFFRRHRWLILLILFLLSLIFLGISTYIFLDNIGKSENPTIEAAEFETSLDLISNINGNITPLTEGTAKKIFEKNGVFKGSGEVLLVQKIESGKYIIKYFSDGTSLMVDKTTNEITRVAPLSDGSYGINENGKIDSSAKKSVVTVTKKVDYDWGNVTYYSDGSAEITNSKYDIFVRDADDIKEKYISDNKVTYLKETKIIGKNKLNYYYDGTIEVIVGNQSYLVRNNNDLSIDGSNVKFNNNNQAKIIETKKLKDGNTIDYYEDGGAIIRNGAKTISVRKSNSIVIKNDKIYEIVDSIYVTVSKSSPDGKITYYTNGSAVINHNGKTLYIPENSNVKYDNNKKITEIGNDYETLTNETNIDGEHVQTFEHTAVVKTNKYIAIIPKESIIYNPDGTIKEIIDSNINESEDPNTFTITNNTDKDIKYRVVIEKSSRTTLDTQYIRYLLSVNDNYDGVKKFNKVWENDSIKEALNPTGINYILVDSTLKAYSTDNIKLMLWTDYDTIPNSMQDKYFYGTIRIYAWKEIDKD